MMILMAWMVLMRMLNSMMLVVFPVISGFYLHNVNACFQSLVSTAGVGLFYLFLQCCFIEIKMSTHCFLFRWRV